MNSPHRNLQLLALSALPMSLKASILYTSAGATTFTTSPVYFAIETGSFGPVESVNSFALSTANSKPSLSSSVSGQIIGMRETGGAFVQPENFVVRLGAGETIGSSANWQTGGLLSKPGYAGSINAGDRGYVGLRIGSDASGYNYGWADISYNVGESVTLHAFAMETTVNTPILAGAGAVPEPAETAFAAALAAGSVAAFRARRRMLSRRAAGR